MPGPFTRGQWNTTGSGTLSAAQWHVAEAGAGGAAPYDALLNAAGALTNFTGAQAGMRLGEARGQTGGVQTPFITWDTGGVWDSVAEQFIFTLWGGDGGESTNEVNVWDFATGTWNPTGRPFNPTTRLHTAQSVNWPAVFAPYNGPSSLGGPAAVRDLNGYYTAGLKAATGSGLRLAPLGRHTYGGMVFMPTVRKVWAWGGFGDWLSGTVPFVMAEWDTTTNQWQMIDGADGNAFGGGVFHGNFTAASCWDSVANRVLFTNSDGLWAYNPAAAAGSRTTFLRSDGTLASTLGNSTMVFDSTRNHAFLLGAPTATTFTEFDFSGGHTTSPIVTARTPTGTLWPTTTGSSGVGFGPGALYDPIADRYIVWVGGTTLYSVHPTTYVSTAIGGTGTIDPGTPTVGIWHRFDYVASADVYVTINNATVGGAYVFAPTRILPPVLACSDLTSGKRTGNPDTAFGQTANVNGAYVTVWGDNLLGTTVTATVGGVSALIVDSGQALPPHCPPTLYNAYTLMHCLTLQIPAGAPLGAQLIHVVVDGQASTATDLPFTVTTAGTIRLSTATGGALQAVLDSMVSGDITYLQTGAALTSGWQMGANTNGSNSQMAVGAYPGASVQFGDNSHDAIVSSASGSGQNLTVFKLTCVGNSVVPFQPITLGTQTRFVGNTLTCPGGLGSAGGIGSSSSAADNWNVLANEFFNVGASPTDDNYHVVYRGGRRNVTANPRIEGPTEIAYNYFHDNNAARAINCFNANGGGVGDWCNPIGDIHVHHNVIVNQQQAGIGILSGCVGTNRVHDNLLINCGLNDHPSSSTPPAEGMELHPRYTDAFPDTSVPITLEVSNNTLFNCGGATSSSRGAYQIRNTPLYTLTFKNNITYQATGLPYISTDSDLPATQNATRYSNNLWFSIPAAAPPPWDSTTLNVNPQVIADTVPYNFRLQTTSPAIGAGVVLSTTSTDLVGAHRATSGVWDLGPYAFTGVTTATAPLLTSLSPASCLPGAATFTLTVFASPTQPFVTGATVFWDGAPRTTTFVTGVGGQQCTITVPASDVVLAGAHLITATNPGSSVSNTLQFNVQAPVATMTMTYDGKLRDRVSQGANADPVPDGHIDAVFTVTVGSMAGRSLTQLTLTSPQTLPVVGPLLLTWITVADHTHNPLGVGLSLDGPLLNNLTTRAINFAPADGSSFKIFATDDLVLLGYDDFLPGSVFTLTGVLSDGSSVVAVVTITQNLLIISLDPSSQPIRSPAFALSVTGTGFQNGASVRWNGGARATTYVSSTLIQATVLATDLLALGTASVTVVNADTSVSNALTFTITPVMQTGIFVGTVM